MEYEQYLDCICERSRFRQDYYIVTIIDIDGRKIHQAVPEKRIKGNKLEVSIKEYSGQHAKIIANGRYVWVDIHHLNTKEMIEQKNN